MAIKGREKGSDSALLSEIEKYEAAVRRDPDSRVFAALADAYRRAGQLDQAIRIAEQGLKIHPRYLSGVVVLGRAYLESGRAEDARAQLERVVEINPDNLTAQRTLGDIYFDRKEWEKAQKAYSAILRVQPDDRAILARLQQIESSAREPAREEEKYEPAVGAEKAVIPEETQAPVPQAPTPAPSPATIPHALSEEEKMDVFFAGVDLSRHEEDSRSLDYQVKPVHEIFDSRPAETDQGFSKTGKASTDIPAAKRKSPITTETMAELYLKQGYKDKALKVYEEIYQAEPSNLDIAGKIEALRSELGLEPEPEAALTPETAQADETAQEAPAMNSQAPQTDEPGEKIPVPTPGIARPSRALKDWWESDLLSGGSMQAEQPAGPLSEDELRIRNLREYLEIIRQGGKA
jgi:tetratricopeptide (TPR) repeat protein